MNLIQGSQKMVEVSLEVSYQVPATYLRYSSECKKFSINYYMAVMAIFCMAYLILTIISMIIPVLQKQKLPCPGSHNKGQSQNLNQATMAPEQTLFATMLL